MSEADSGGGLFAAVPAMLSVETATPFYRLPVIGRPASAPEAAAVPAPPAAAGEVEAANAGFSSVLVTDSGLDVPASTPAFSVRSSGVSSLSVRACASARIWRSMASLYAAAAAKRRSAVSLSSARAAATRACTSRSDSARSCRAAAKRAALSPACSSRLRLTAARDASSRAARAAASASCFFSYCTWERQQWERKHKHKVGMNGPVRWVGIGMI